MPIWKLNNFANLCENLIKPSVESKLQANNFSPILAPSKVVPGLLEAPLTWLSAHTCEQQKSTIQQVCGTQGKIEIVYVFFALF